MVQTVLYLGLDASRYCKPDTAVIHYPIIKISPRPIEQADIQYALSRFSLYTHLIITSKTTIKILIDYLSQAGYPLSMLSQKTIIVVGKVTASYLHQINIFPRIARNETAEGILEVLESQDLQETFFFWPHSAQSRSVIADYFKAQTHASLTECLLYDTSPLEQSFKPNLNSIDEIVFTSPSTVDAFQLIFGHLPKDKQLTAIGPITEAYLMQKI